MVDDRKMYGYRDYVIHNDRQTKRIQKLNDVINCIDRMAVTLMKLGFKEEDIWIAKDALRYNGKRSTNGFVEYGVDYKKAYRLKYMCDIAEGRVVIRTKEDMVKHLKKMYEGNKRIGLEDLLLTRVSKIPRKAFIGGIRDTKYSMYNSKNYRSMAARLYDVEKTTQNKVVIKTQRKPVLRRGESKVVEGVIEVVGLDNDKKTVTIEVDKKYCRLCNRFIVVGSLRRPEFHHGMVEILCVDGSIVYVYAQTMSNSNSELPNYKGGTQRVYDYGYLKTEILPKLVHVSNEIYEKVHGVIKTNIRANSDYEMMRLEEKEEDREVEGLVE